MEYLVCILILPWLVYTLYEDWKDAHKTRSQHGKEHSARNISHYKGFSKSSSGNFLLILGFAAIAP
jgi:hypothetical protein